MNRDVKMATIKISAFAVGGIASLVFTAWAKKKLGV